ncbi:MAG TPA: FAD-dependent oxidoreductase [Thermohalobaculum sp.]|nr:FAD-dependent oxidoreductase [Thermohalobaculum sp.]
MTAAYDLVVVGGGINGATVALFAARGGMRVALIERDQICRGASGTNAGTLTMQMTRAALIPYALEAHAMWSNARDWLGHDVGVVICDGLSLAFTEREEELLLHRSARRREAGAPIEVVSGAEAQRIEPGLGPGARAAGWCKMDGFANAYLTGLAYRRALLASGVTLLEQTAATGVQAAGPFEVATTRGPVRGGRLLIAGGVWIEPMLTWLGVALPIKVLINQLSVTERIRPVMRTQLGIASGLLSLKQFPHGTVVIGGGWQGWGDRETNQNGIRPDSIIGNVRLACHAIPALAGARLARAWTGFEAETADAMPAVGPVPGVHGAFVCGSIHSGYTSGPYIAKLLAERILGGEPERQLFPIERLLSSPAAPPNSLTATTEGSKR